MSMQSVRNKTKNPQAISTQLGESLTASAPVTEKMVSHPSRSSIDEVYCTREAQRSWENDVKFHVSRHLIHLRHHRNETQGSLAKAVKTSQAAIARIESGEENITLSTLERIINALRGRFYVSISPEEYALAHHRPWWESSAESFQAYRATVVQHTATGQTLIVPESTQTLRTVQATMTERTANPLSATS